MENAIALATNISNIKSIIYILYNVLCVLLVFRCIVSNAVVDSVTIPFSILPICQLKQLQFMENR